MVGGSNQDLCCTWWRHLGAPYISALIIGPQVFSIGDVVWAKVVDIQEGDPRGLKISCSIKLVSQADGADMDPTNLKYRPRVTDPQGKDLPVGAMAAQQTQHGVVDWGHLKAGDKVRAKLEVNRIHLTERIKRRISVAINVILCTCLINFPVLHMTETVTHAQVYGDQKKQYDVLVSDDDEKLPLPPPPPGPYPEPPQGLGLPGLEGITSVEQALALLKSYKKHKKDKKHKKGHKKKHKKDKDKGSHKKKKSKKKASKKSSKRAGSSSSSGGSGSSSNSGSSSDG